MLKRRKRLFRLMAVVLGLLVFPVAEVLCQLAGWGAVATSTNAFSEFAGVRPLFEKSDDGERFVVAKNRRAFFAEEFFPARKPVNTRRIFVFGGSTVQGRPYSIPTAFTTFLKIGLQHADPSVNWEVVNCGGVSYASYRLLPILKESLNHKPDLFIVCTGHNEFLECLTYGEVRTASPVVKTGYGLLRDFHSFRVLQRALQPSQEPGNASPSAVLPEEVDAILDHHGGLEAYTRESLSRSEIVSAFADNLKHMVALAAAENIPLMIMQPPSNLRDCPPFKSQFAANTTLETQAQIEALLSTASDHMQHHKDKAVALLKEVVALDDEFAFSWYQLGQAYLSVNRPDDAAAALVRARDEDICPLRMTSELEGVMKRIVAEHSVPFIDLHQQMAGLCRDSIVGDSVLVDHIHPSFRSNQLIALGIIRWMHDAGCANVLSNDWQPAAETAFQEHLLSLDDLYFLRGRRTRQSLAAWTQGRADGPPLSRSSKMAPPVAE
ncbi:SGNH/GDSL hydrolase family protein [Fuerstiella marisgermanici]|uniref:GDSL-like Lipase/Acylhydrolase n=1 Tax=Fuerstiella marisgermanici TaxID=1891926 RepID=A0A1P8WM16_9PLAN|nr:SGNH/GDSL hydrolase family protein [Fuerstiella marisgermanici]APZ95087.1 hypothetical protein Fuma_04741 [Fuerstiella marisgermanici]